MRGNPRKLRIGAAGSVAHAAGTLDDALTGSTAVGKNLRCFITNLRISAREPVRYGRGPSRRSCVSRALVNSKERFRTAPGGSER